MIGQNSSCLGAGILQPWAHGLRQHEAHPVYRCDGRKWQASHRAEGTRVPSVSSMSWCQVLSTGCVLDPLVSYSHGTMAMKALWCGMSLHTPGSACAQEFRAGAQSTQAAFITWRIAFLQSRCPLLPVIDYTTMLIKLEIYSKEWLYFF